MYTRMDPRDRDDQAEAAVLAGTGEDASAEECVPPAVVSVGDRGCEGAPEEQASASLALSGEREREGAAAAAEVADASPVVSGDGGVLAENVFERRGNQGDEEDDGYVTPTSPRHRLRAPEVCPPAPMARSAPTTLPSSRLRPALMARLAASAPSPSGPRGRKRIQADDDPDDLVSALMRSMRRRLFPPEDGKNPM